MNKGIVQIVLAALAIFGGGSTIIINSHINHPTASPSIATQPVEQTASPSIASQPAEQIGYTCSGNGADVVMFGHVGSNERAIMGFNSDKWGKDLGKLKRCKIVAKMLEKYDSYTITTGYKNDYAILCASKGKGQGCIEDESKGQILTLGRRGIDSQKYLNTFAMTLKPGVSESSLPPFIQTQSRVYINLYKIIKGESNYFETEP
jgi:Circadian oscillating protein COP23